MIRPLTRYVVGAAADQTIVYLARDGLHTTKHSEAKLFFRKSRAEAARVKFEGDFIEDVINVKEFVSREDTW